MHEKLAWLPPLQHPRKYSYFHTHLHANPTPHQASLSFPTNLAGAAFGVRRRCFSSERLSLGRRRQPTRHPLRLLPWRGRRRHRRRHPSTGVVASKAIYLHRLGAALEAATPSLSSTSLLVEVSPERAAQMERMLLGCEGAMKKMKPKAHFQPCLTHFQSPLVPFVCSFLGPFSKFLLLLYGYHFQAHFWNPYYYYY